LTLNKYKQKSGTSVKRDGSCLIFANIHWAILPRLLLADGLISQILHIQPIGTFAQQGSILFGNFPIAFQYPLELLIGYLITFEHFAVASYTF
jgi:hypothetical protein